MRLVRIGLLSAAVWAGMGVSTASAQRFNFNFNYRPPLPGGFGAQVNVSATGSPAGFTYNYSSRFRAGPFVTGQNVSGFNTLNGFGYTYNGFGPLYGLSPGIPYAAYPYNPYAFAYGRAYDPYATYVQGPPLNLPLTPIGGEAAPGRQGVFNEWVGNRAQPGVDRQEAAREVLERNLNQPAANDVTSGAALNAILAALDANRGRLKDVPPVAIPEETQGQINFTKGVSGGNAGLLADGGKLAWTRGLVRLTETEGIRADLEKAVGIAYKQATDGKPVDAKTIADLDRLSRDLESAVSMNVSKLGFDDHRDAKKFLKSLDDAIAFLKQADAGQWLPGKVAIAGKSVQELVKTLGEKGARFAPATPGSENAYIAMHKALADYFKQAVPHVAAAPK